MKRAVGFAAAASAVCLYSLSVQAQYANFCTGGGDEKFSLGFDIKPSLVVHSDAVMDATRGDLGLDGNANERAFSLRRTIGAILESAGSASDDAAQQAFVQTMIDSFQVPTGQALNSAAGILMPFDNRSEAAELSAADMLDDASATAMKPLALFNRFDLAPNNWSHCGEHRIVYGRTRVNPASPLDRFLLIFEAMVPNPDPGAGAAGCRRVAEFWAGLTGQSDSDQANLLSDFYYDGITGHADGDLVDANGDPSPVVSFRNYGGDGGRGQVRANAFMEPKWQLREWLTQLTFAQTGPALAFVPVTVKGNPLAQLFRDDLSGDTELLTNNVPAAVANLHGDFVQALTSQMAPQLLSEGSEQHQTLAAGLEDYDLGAAPVTEETILLNTIGLGNDDKFNEHQSVSQGGEDVPGEPAGSSATIRALLDAFGSIPSANVTPQTGQTLLNRARAVTCGGCHMTASRSAGGFFAPPGVIVRENADGTVVRWPDIHPDLFVHVSENSRELSPALETGLLPVRRYVLGRYLCEALEEPVVAEPEPTPEPIPEPYEQMLASRDLPVEQLTSGMRYLDDLLGSYAQEGRDGRTEMTAPAAEDVQAMIADRSEAERGALRVRVHEAIDAARAIEQQRPGAFYETRRPH
jgi:hypothetical protein